MGGGFGLLLLFVFLKVNCTFFFVVLGFELRAYTLSHSISPFFVKGFFQDRVSRAICLGWL
jgi:hypothetical protein